MTSVLAPIFCCLLFCGFTFRLTEDLGSLDWGNGEVSPLIVQQLMEGLTTSGLDGAPVPALASRWVAANGARHFTFTLRAGAKWSDGKPVCAQQFVDAWQRVRSPEFASPYAHYLAELQSARAVGCRRLEVTLRHSAAYFPALASHWVLAPIRLELIKKFGRDWQKPSNLVVTGPYTLAQWTPDKEYVLKANPAYYGAPAKEELLRAIVIGDDATAQNLFQAGSIDWLRDVPFLEKERLAKTAEYSAFPAFVEYHLGFSMAGPGTLDRNARCALALAIDKARIPGLLKGGELPAAGILPPGLGGAAALPPLDLAKARALWAASPWSGKGPLELNYYAKDIHGMLVQWLQQEWKKNLGADVQLVRTEPKSYWARLQQRAPAIFLSGITAAYAHPYSIISEFVTGSGGNWGGFSNRDYDTMAVKISGAAATDTVLLRRAQQLLVDQECAVIPLYFRKTASLLKSGWQGLKINPMTYVYLKAVWRASKK